MLDFNLLDNIVGMHLGLGSLAEFYLIYHGETAHWVSLNPGPHIICDALWNPKINFWKVSEYTLET